MASTLTVIGATWLCIRFIDIVSKLKQQQLAVRVNGKNRTGTACGEAVPNIGADCGRLVIFYIAGINIAAALTGLGIGGIAIAFAAQKTLENLFGGIMIISDQPIRVGDFCRAGDHTRHTSRISACARPGSGHRNEPSYRFQTASSP